MFIAISQFTIANDKTEEVREAFRNRPHLVEDAPGFIRMEVISPRELPAEIWLLTYWEQKTHSQNGTRATCTTSPTREFPKG